MSRQRTARTATRVAIAALLGLTIAPTPQAATRRPITETDLFSFVWIADPQMAPDGSRVAFLRVAVNRQKEQYETSIWIAGTGAGGAAPQPFTAGPGDSSPRWSPDGTRLAFVRAAETEGRVQPPQIYVMGMSGGEPRAVTDIPRGAGAPAWAPDGKAIAFASSARPDEFRAPTRRPNPRAAMGQTPERRSCDHRRGLPRQRHRRHRLRRCRSPVADLGLGAPGHRRRLRRRYQRHERRIRRRQPPVVSGRQRHLLRLEPPPRVLLLSRRQRPLRRVPSWGGAAAGRRHRRAHRPIRLLSRRQAHRLHLGGKRQA